MFYRRGAGLSFHTTKTPSGQSAVNFAVLHNAVWAPNDVIHLAPRLEGLMKRRNFISLVGGAAAWPFAVRAQQPKVWRIGVLSSVPPTPAMLSALRDGMRERGYVEGQNLSIEVRWPQGTFERDPSPVV